MGVGVLVLGEVQLPVQVVLGDGEPDDAAELLEPVVGHGEVLELAFQRVRASASVPPMTADSPGRDVHFVGVAAVLADAGHSHRRRTRVPRRWWAAR